MTKIGKKSPRRLWARNQMGNPIQIDESDAPRDDSRVSLPGNRFLPIARVEIFVAGSLAITSLDACGDSPLHLGGIRSQAAHEACDQTESNRSGQNRRGFGRYRNSLDRVSWFVNTRHLQDVQDDRKS